MSVLLLSLLLGATPPSPLPPDGVYELAPAPFIEQAIRDLAALRRYSDGLDRLGSQVQAHRELFASRTRQAFTPEEKRTILSTWGALFAYFSSVEQLRQRYWAFVELAPTDTRHAWGFVVTHTALTTLLASGLAFADLTQGGAQLETLLDEPNGEFGVPLGSYAEFKLKALHVATATQLFTGDTWRPAAERTLRVAKALQRSELAWALAKMAGASKAARASLAHRGVTLFLTNATDIAQDGFRQTVFPVQRAFAAWAGDARVARVGQPLITRAQIDELLPSLEPGDLVLARQNWFLSNIALPGFWPHAELYVGSAAELSASFDGDAEVSAWAKSEPERADTLSQLLKRRFPRKWAAYQTGVDLQGHGPIRVIEAVSEGVSFTAVEHALMVDYLAVLRPRLGKLEKARAITRAFAYQGRPYDFDFDFFSDASLVCTELVFKAYAPSPELGMRGLTVALVDVAGRSTLPANEWVRLFDAEADRPDAQLDFVAFLDGQEKPRRAVLGTRETFRASHARLKWDIAQR